MTVKLASPHPFKERHLFFGGGGSGKTYTALKIAECIATGIMHVIETDLSEAWARAMATDFDVDNVTMYPGDQEWESFLGRVQEAVSEGNPADDWLTVDSSSFSYDAVQGWTMEQLYGNDMVSMLINLRKQYIGDDKGFFAAKSELMNWDIVKKEYLKFWKLIEKWKGHLILTAEAKPTSNREKDDEMKMMYGPLGFQPVGQARVNHATSTTLFLSHPRRDEWQITTIKDRNRERVDRLTVTDFAVDYLMEVAGWEPVRRHR